MDIHYTRGNIGEAVAHLATGDERLPARALDAYLIASRGENRKGFERGFEELDSIFKGVCTDNVSAKVTLDKARRAAHILLHMYDTLARSSL